MLSEVVKDPNNIENGVRWSNSDFVDGKIHVGVILKNEAGHLENVRNWFGGIKSAGLIGKVRLLFIDDESDSATPNTNCVGSNEIECEEDIEQKIDILRNAQDINGNVQVADWLVGFCARLGVKFESAGCVSGNVEAIFDDNFRKMQQKMVNAVAPKVFLDSYVLRDEEFKRISGLDKSVTIDGTKWNLYELVRDAFNRRRTKAFPLSARVLRDCFNFLFNVRQERSRINQSVCDIAGGRVGCGEPVFGYDRLVYAGYTATPFANLLNEDPTEDPLCPDCIKPLATSPKYFGLQRIFGGNADVCNMNIVRTISEDEKSGWISPLQERDDGAKYADADADEGVRCSFVQPDMERVHNFGEAEQPDDSRTVEWASLKKAVKWAFCTAAARRTRRLELGGSDDDRSNNTDVRWTTMLFNISHLSNQETGVHLIQQQLLKSYIEKQRDEKNREEFIESCLKVWREETAADGGFTLDDFKRSCGGYENPIDYPDVDAVRNNLCWFLDNGGKYQVIQMNSSSGNVIQEDYYKYGEIAGDVLWFVCGGNAISRGLTLDGLTVSYFDRIKGSSAVDTITQMGRWFGYREGYELLPRIWMTRETIDEMKEICRTEESLHQELQALYDDEDKTSIRNGRDVAAIKYFGRRLSGRDANGIKFNGAASKEIFTVVSNRPETALGITKSFVGCIGPTEAVPDVGEESFRNRHELFWRDVPKETVSEYIGLLKDQYFTGVSVYQAQGLLREIGNSLCNWNVVVGNPEVHHNVRTVGEPGGVFTQYKRRNNPIRVIGNEVQLGTGQWTSLAFLARVPDEIVKRAHEGLPPINDGDVRHVEAAYRLLSQCEGALRTLANPTLLIDFVNGPSECAFVQVGFYWYGHNAESYFKAKTSPVQKPCYMPAVMSLLAEVGYAGFDPLVRMVEKKLKVEVDEDELSSQLRDECQASDSSLRTFASGACNAVIQNKVYYTKDWLDANRVPTQMTDAEQIGLALYWEIEKNGWHYKDNKNLLHHSCIERANRDQIVAVRWVGYGKYEVLMGEYFRHYRELEQSLFACDCLAGWWDGLPHDDFRKQRRNAALAQAQALNDVIAYQAMVAGLDKRIQLQIEALSLMFGVEPFGRLHHPDLEAARVKISHGQNPRDFGAFVAVGLLRPTVRAVEEDHTLLLGRFTDAQARCGDDADILRATLNIIVNQQEFRTARIRLALCKVLIQRYAGGIAEIEQDAGGLQRTHLSPVLMDRLKKEDAAIRADNSVESARKACEALGKTIDQFGLQIQRLAAAANP